MLKHCRPKLQIGQNFSFQLPIILMKMRNSGNQITTKVRSQEVGEILFCQSCITETGIRKVGKRNTSQRRMVLKKWSGPRFEMVENSIVREKSFCQPDYCGSKEGFCMRQSVRLPRSHRQLKQQQQLIEFTRPILHHQLPC